MRKILTTLTFISFCVLSNDDLMQELVLSANKTEQTALLLKYLQQNSRTNPQASIDLINSLSPHLFLYISSYERLEIELWHSISLTKLRKHQAALDKLNEILEKNNLEKNALLVRIYSTRARVYNALSEHDSALADTILALENLKDTQYSSQKASILRLKGLTYLYQDKLKEAYEVLLRAKEQYDHVTDPDGELNVLADIAYVYRKFGMLDIALEYELRVVEGRNKLGDKEKIVTSLHNAALAYRDLYFYEQATQLLNQAIKIEKELNLEYNLSLSYIVLSEVLRLQNKLDDAEWFLKESITLSNKINNLYTLNRAYLNVGRLLMQKNDLNNAKIYLLKSIDYFTKTKSPKRIALISLELAILYSRLGQHEAAESYLLKTIQNAQKSGITQQLIRAHKLLADEYAQTNSYQAAYETLKKYQELSKIQFDTNSQRRIELLVVKNQIKETKSNLALLKQKAKLKESELNNAIINRNFFILGVICLVGLVGVIYKRRVLKKELSTSEINKAAIAKREQILNVALWASEGVLCHINIKTLTVKQNFNKEGTTLSENITTPIEELLSLIHPDDIKNVTQALESIETGKQTAIDVSYRL